MPNKQAIIENVDMYSADELVKFIKEVLLHLRNYVMRPKDIFLLLLVKKWKENLQALRKRIGK